MLKDINVKFHTKICISEHTPQQVLLTVLEHPVASPAGRETTQMQLVNN